MGVREGGGEVTVRLPAIIVDDWLMPWMALREEQERGVKQFAGRLVAYAVVQQAYEELLRAGKLSIELPTTEGKS